MIQTRRALARFYFIGKKIWNKLFPASIPTAPPIQSSLTELENSVVVITGSSRGIGLALAQTFAEKGARVVINGRTESELKSAEESLVNKAFRILAVQSDVSSSSGAKKLIDQSLSHFGQIDVLINNAGVMGPIDKPIWEVSTDEWNKVLSVNLMAAINCTAFLASEAVKSRRPVKVLNVSSGIVGHGLTNLGPYAVSKDALEAVTRAYSWDSEDGLVCVVSIQPRSVRSSMTKRYFGHAEYAMMDEPKSVAPVFLWAATAPAALVHGRSFSEPLFAADQSSARSIRGQLIAAQPITIKPVTFVAGSGNTQQPGAYMHLLENAHGFYPSAKDRLHEELLGRDIYSYPDPEYLDLTQALARETGLKTDQIALGAGSSEIINRILQIFTAPGDSILVTKPTWSFFHAFSARWQLIPTQVPMLGSLSKGSLKHDLNGLLAAITLRTRVLYLVNPCNPTGSMLPREELEAFIARVPEHIILVLDEAYIQYSDPGLRSDPGELLESCKARLIILRTFSKFFALSGFRIGYACASVETVNLLSRAIMPFGITTAASKVVPAVLNDSIFRQQVFDSNVEGRRQLEQGLSKLGIDYLPGQTNFILFSCPTDPKRLQNELKKKGLILPDVDQFLQNYSVLAVGNAEHNKLVLEALSKY